MAALSQRHSETALGAYYATLPGGEEAMWLFSPPPESWQRSFTVSSAGETGMWMKEPKLSKNDSTRPASKSRAAKAKTLGHLLAPATT
jgi:hypothetical protein